jgi:hypothetical protein
MSCRMLNVLCFIGCCQRFYVSLDVAKDSLFHWMLPKILCFIGCCQRCCVSLDVAKDSMFHWVLPKILFHWMLPKNLCFIGCCQIRNSPIICCLKHGAAEAFLSPLLRTAWSLKLFHCLFLATIWSLPVG